MTIPRYPLHQVEEVKQRRVEEAEKILKEKVNDLEKETKELDRRKEEETKVHTHYKDKLSQMRQEMDGGTTSNKIEQMRTYLKLVIGQWEVKKKEVSEQQTQVETAQKAVDVAKRELTQKLLDVEKMKTHRKEWSKEMKKTIEIAEAKKHDELGAVIHETQKRRNKG